MPVTQSVGAGPSGDGGPRGSAERVGSSAPCPERGKLPVGRRSTKISPSLPELRCRRLPPCCRDRPGSHRLRQPQVPLHDRRIPGTRANIDHIAVSASGVYVIDAKNYTGTVRVDWEGGLLRPRRHKLTVGRRDATRLVVGVQRQVQLVRDVLAGDPRLPDDVAVTGLLAFFDSDWPLFPPDRIEDVRLEGPRSTSKLIRLGGPYTPQGVAMFAGRLRAHFPPA